MYTVVRADIEPGYQVVQSCHATADFIVANPLISYLWNRNSNVMVSLNVPDQHHLLALASQLNDSGVPCKLFYEPDISAYTALCTTDAGAPLMRGLPLALKNISKEIKRRLSSVAEQRSLKPQVVGSSPSRH